MNENIILIVSEKLNITVKQVKAVMELIGEGATIPFIARYRKEQTGGLDEDQIRSINLTYEYEDKLATRKEEVLRLIEEKGKLTEELRDKIIAAATLTEVEDLYLPYKEKKKTRATVAIARGLQPLADYMLNPKNPTPEEEAKKYIEEGHFAPGSMLPKIEACMDFVESGDGSEALITSLEKAKDAINGLTGTIIKK